MTEINRNDYIRLAHKDPHSFDRFRINEDRWLGFHLKTPEELFLITRAKNNHISHTDLVPSLTSIHEVGYEKTVENLNSYCDENLEGTSGWATILTNGLYLCLHPPDNYRKISIPVITRDQNPGRNGIMIVWETYSGVNEILNGLEKTPPLREQGEKPIPDFSIYATWLQGEFRKLRKQEGPRNLFELINYKWD